MKKGGIVLNDAALFFSATLFLSLRTGRYP